MFFLTGDNGSIVFQFTHDLAVFLGDGKLALADVVGGKLHCRLKRAVSVSIFVEMICADGYSHGRCFPLPSWNGRGGGPGSEGDASGGEHRR